MPWICFYFCYICFFGFDCCLVLCLLLSRLVSFLFPRFLERMHISFPLISILRERVVATRPRADSAFDFFCANDLSTENWLCNHKFKLLCCSMCTLFKCANTNSNNKNTRHTKSVLTHSTNSTQTYFRTLHTKRSGRLEKKTACGDMHRRKVSYQFLV